MSPPRELLDSINIEPDDFVIDYGCGPGFYTLELARRSSRVVGVDVSSKMLEKAVKVARKAGLEIVALQSDGRKLDLENGVADLVFLAWVYHEIQSRQEALAEFHRVLKPQGSLIIVENTKKPLLGLGPPKADPEQLRTEVEASSFRLQHNIPYKNSMILVFTKIQRS